MIRLLAITMSLSLWLVNLLLRTPFPWPRFRFLAAIVIDGEELSNVRGWSALPAQERAEKIEARVAVVAEASDNTTVAVEILDTNSAWRSESTGRW